MARRFKSRAILPLGTRLTDTAPKPSTMRAYLLEAKWRAPLHLKRFSSRELLTTDTLDRAIAAPARAGAKMPTAARGIMVQL